MTDQGVALAAYVHELLGDERKRRETLDERGFGVVKTAGAVVALVVGFAALVLGVDYRPQTRWALVLVAAALVILTTATGLALGATRMLRYAMPSEKWHRRDPE